MPGMFPCEHPDLFCGPSSADNSAILSSARTRGPSRDAQAAAMEARVISPIAAPTAGLIHYRIAIRLGSPQTVPIHILNSVLSL